MTIAFVAQKCWKLCQLDIKSAFIYDEFKEDISVEQPKGYEKKGSEEMVYKLQKALYGLKQAPITWFSRIKSYFIKKRFNSSSNEQTLFIKRKEDKILIVNIYVDDLLFTGDDEKLLEEFKLFTKKEFDMTDLGQMSFSLE